MFEDHNHRLWAATAAHGLSFFDPQRDSMVAWKSKRIQDGHTGQPAARGRFTSLHHLAESADGRLWLLVGNTETKECGLASIDPLRQVLTHFSTKTFLSGTALDPASTPWLTTFWVDEKERCIWAGGYGFGLLQFSMERHSWQRYDLNSPQQRDPLNNFVADIQSKNDSTLWLATETGLKIFSTAQGHWTGFNPDPTHPWEAQKTQYLAVFRDQAGTTWFGTAKGLSRLDPYRQQFAKHSPLPDGFRAQAIAEYAPTGERLFAAWDADGFFRVFAQHRQHGKIRQASQRLPFRPNDVASVHQLYVAPDGRIWVLLNQGRPRHPAPDHSQSAHCQQSSLRDHQSLAPPDDRRPRWPPVDSHLRQRHCPLYAVHRAVLEPPGVAQPARRTAR